MMCFVIFGQEMQVNFCMFLSVVLTAGFWQEYSKSMLWPWMPKLVAFKRNLEVCPDAPCSLKIPCRMSGVWENLLTRIVCMDRFLSLGRQGCP